MAELKPMDILRELTPEERKVGYILSWAVDDRKDKNGDITMIFKKDTPQKILKAYLRDLNLMPFKANRKFEIEK